MRPTRHFGHMGAAASYVKTDARPALVYEADRYTVARMGVMTRHKLLINVVKLAGEKICLLSSKMRYLSISLVQR